MPRWKTAGEFVTGIAALAAAAVLIYLGAWWLRADTKDRTVQIDNHNTGAQTAWRDETLEHIAEIEVLHHSPQTSAAIAALTDSACDLIGRLTDTYRNDQRIVAFWEKECI